MSSNASGRNMAVGYVDFIFIYVAIFRRTVKFDFCSILYNFTLCKGECYLKISVNVDQSQELLSMCVIIFIV